MLDAGIVNEDVDTAKCSPRERDRVGDFRWLAHVRGRIDSLHPKIILNCRPLFLDIGWRPNPIKNDVGASAR
jgi:hypothetical protein